MLTEKEDGIAFDCTLETEEIELKRISRPVGTTIRIKLSKHAAEHLLTTIRKDGKNFRQLPIGPYLLPYPSVQLFVNGKCVPRRDPWPAEGSEVAPASMATIRGCALAIREWRMVCPRKDCVEWSGTNRKTSALGTEGASQALVAERIDLRSRWPTWHHA